MPPPARSRRSCAGTPSAAGGAEPKDVHRGLDRIAQRVPQLADRGIQARIEIDERVRRPQASSQLLARCQLAWLLQQKQQHLERFVLKPDQRAIVAQFAGDCVELEGAKAVEAPLGCWFVHGQVRCWKVRRGVYTRGGHGAAWPAWGIQPANRRCAGTFKTGNRRGPLSAAALKARLPALLAAQLQRRLYENRQPRTVLVWNRMPLPGPHSKSLCRQWITEFSDWSEPVNLGPPVNSALEELDSFLSKDGRSLYFGSLRPGGSVGTTSGLRGARASRNPGVFRKTSGRRSILHSTTASPPCLTMVGGCSSTAIDPVGSGGRICSSRDGVASRRLRVARSRSISARS